MDQTLKETLKKKISNRETKVCIIGLGYVGLPNALDFARKGFSVLGIDIDKERVQKFNRGENYILGTDEKGELKKFVAAGKVSAQVDFSDLGQMDVIVICVPTSLSSNLARFAAYKKFCQGNCPASQGGSLSVWNLRLSRHLRKLFCLFWKAPV